MDGFWRPTRLSAVKRSEGANENGLISPCRKLVAVVTSHHSGWEKHQAKSAATIQTQAKGEWGLRTIGGFGPFFYDLDEKAGLTSGMR
jgi:hypothetical protein